MKIYLLDGLLVAQPIVAAQPAVAASLEEATTVQSGTFAGARIRLSLGGSQPDRKFRAGLTVAPAMRSQTISGETRMRIGEGVELGFAGKRPLALSLAGRPVDRLLPGDNRKQGLSTGGKVAIGVTAALLVGAGAFYLAIQCDEDERECSE